MEFIWRDVLNPRFNQPRWNVEFGPAVSIPVRMLRTTLMLTRPWRFWRELQMHHKPRWTRLLALYVMVPLVLYAVFAISIGIATWYWSSRSGTVARRPSPPAIEAIKAAINPWRDVGNTLYGPMPSSVRRNFEWNRIALDGWAGVRASLDVINPGDSRSIISQRGFDAICTLIACPMGFLLLPISRKTARVRWAHIARIGAYGLMFAIVPITIDYYDQVQGVRYRWTAEVADSGALLMGCMVIVWWAAASRNYLRMPHAWAIAAYVVAFGYLFQRLVWHSIDMTIVLSK